MRSGGQRKLLGGDAARYIKPSFGAAGSVRALIKVVAARGDESAIRQNSERLSDRDFAARVGPRNVRRDGDFSRPGSTGKQLARRRLFRP